MLNKNIMNRLLFLVVLFISCNKDKEPTMAIKVQDSITGTPVAGADVSLYPGGSVPAALGSKSVFTGKTDANGVVNVPVKAFNDLSNELNVRKADYLDFQVQRSTLLLLRPKGWLRFHIVKTGTYAVGSRIGISNEFITNSVLVSAPNDSTFIMSGGGGVTNHVSWQVIDQQGHELMRGSVTPQVARLDTTNVLLNY